MSAEKLSSDAVPAKFTEFLLAMGCPTEKVLYEDKIAEMCRGQMYMVWRSLMEHVAAKDIIRKKRLQVFCDDVRRCKKANTFSGQDSSIIVPEQLVLWKQQTELHEKVEDAKARVDEARHTLHQVTEKISKKMLNLAQSRRRVEAVQRRSWLLHQVAAGLRTKKENLQETSSIAHSLCSVNEGSDVQEKFDRCVTSLRRQGAPAQVVAHANSSANSTIAGNIATDVEFEEELCALVRCRGDVLLPRALAARAALPHALASHAATVNTPQHKVTPQSVLAHTASLHCQFALDATKNRINLKNTTDRLTEATYTLNSYLPTDACELLVMQCERVVAEAKVDALRSALQDLAALRPDNDLFQPPHTSLHAVNQIIESKKEELRRLITAMSATERKMHSVREALAAVFASFRDDMAPVDNHRYKGLQLEMPQECMQGIREFYTTQRHRRRTRVDLSLELDVSDNSYSGIVDMRNPSFSDELKLYLKKFNLEKNRKLVLESGTKIWIFETLSSSVSRIHDGWLSNELCSDLLSPSDSLSNNLQKLVLAVQRKEELTATLRALDSGMVVRNIDIESQSEDEQHIIDKTKKRLKESLNILQKSDRSLDSALENLKLWSDNQMKEYLSQDRKVEGVTYRDYEVYYLDSVN